MVKMNRKRWIIVIILVLLIVAVLFVIFRSSNGQSQAEGPATIQVKRATIIQKALAIGSIEPVDEIQVKSKISGVVGKLYADVGDYIREGAPLLEVKPDPTPLELAEAKRDVEMKTIELENLKRELARQVQLQKSGLICNFLRPSIR